MTKKDYSKWKDMDERRLWAMERATIAARVMAPDVFTAIVKTIELKDYNTFKTLCETQAHIDDEGIIEDMWTATRATVDSPASPRPCW